MAKQLVIVESPTKAKTLERYLGREYTVTASKGHVRDLPEDRMGVDLEDEFQPEYEIRPDQQDIVGRLKKAFRTAGTLWLATDFDREGEAIAWHVAEAIGADPRAANRVTFTEITKDAVQEAFRHPRRIDVDLVNAQQARRILDRIVGYQLSPLLSKRLRRALSAGRVQSVALRLIVDREREIAAFVAREYWSVDARLTPEGEETPFLARLIQVGEEKLAASPDKKGLVLSTQEEAEEHVRRLGQAAYRVKEVRQREVKRTPAAPFTTSTLQQEAARKLGFSARKTMQVAQRLYEGINIPGEGQVGLITYMRTDSVNIADQALRELTDVVKEQFGKEYALAQPRRYKKKQRGAQEAHEAIRPTGARRLPDTLEGVVDPNQLRLYRLIWQRTVASQMAEARFDQVSADIEATPSSNGDGVTYMLRATGQTLKFDGFRRVYFEGRDDTADEDAESALPALTAEQLLRLLELIPEQHFTQPPPRYTEATLIKSLEENGIGRPSTYAPTISTLLDRGYVRLDDRRFFPEDIGIVVSDLLVEHFPDIFQVGFTARLEEELDDIAEGKASWVAVLSEFYDPFLEDFKKAEKEMEAPVEELDELCPKCIEEGRGEVKLVKRLGRYGMFIGCPNYPECTYTREINGEERPEPELLDEACPECGRQLQRRVGRYGPFIGCSGYPDCRYVKKEPPKSTGVTCPQCKQGELVERRGRYGLFYSCSRYPDCDFTVNQTPMPEPCPACQGLVVAARGGARRCTNCGRAWDEEGNELSEEEAKALVPQGRRGGRSRSGTGSGARKSAGRKASANGSGQRRTRTRRT